MKKSVVFIIALFSLTVYAQKLSNDSLFFSIYSRNHLGFTFTPNLAQKMKIERFYGSQDYTACSGFGVDFSLNYTFNIKKKYGIKLSCFAGNIPIAYKILLDAETYNLAANITSDLKYKYKYRGFGLDFELRPKPLGKFFLSFNTGVRISQIIEPFGTTVLEIIPKNDSIPRIIFQQNISYDPKKNFYGQLRLVASINLPIRKYNLIRIGISSNITFLNRNSIGGSYFFTNNNGFDTGGYTTRRMDYIGLDLSYIFTGTRRMLKP